jgi:hypothetical protein
MLHMHAHTHNRWQRPRPIAPKPKTKLLDIFLGLIGLVLVAIFMVVWWTLRTPSPAAFVNDPNVALPANASAAVASISFEQTARNLAATNSPEAFQILYQSLELGAPSAQRGIVLTVLKDASPAVVPELIIALDDPDAGVRAGVAQVLGMRREHQAIGALIEVTRNSDAEVRRQAVVSLASLDAWQALPRLEQLLVIDSSSDVRQAAMGAKESFRKEVAQAIGLPAPELREIFGSAGDLPQIYAVTATDLYAQKGIKWERLSRMPDEPLAIAASADPTLIYLSTVSAGLFKSLDGGATWEHIQYGSQTATHLQVTAITIDPQNSNQIFIALASPGSQPGSQDPMGISASTDGGATFWTLEGSPMDLLTTRIVMDPQWEGFLFGITQAEPWRYALPAASLISMNQTASSVASK